MAGMRVDIRLPGRPTPSERALRRRIVSRGGSLRPAVPAAIWRPWENRALASTDEVDAAVAEVQRIGLSPHPDRPKNWDLLVALGSILEGSSRRGRILEMGAAPYSPLLVWLYQYGYRRLHGIDLVYEQPVHRGPIRFEPMDLTATTFPDGAFDAIACLSVIEHGVDVEAYFREARRLLRPGGLLVTSTDYWRDPIDAGGREAYGHPVRIFDAPAIEACLSTAANLGFQVRRPVELGVRERVVHWQRVELEYTFLVLVHVAPDRHRQGRFSGLLRRRVS